MRMKHETKIIVLLLSMFVLTQVIGLTVIDAYTPKTVTIIEDGISKNITVGEEIPYDLEPPQIEPQISFFTITAAFLIAIMLFLILTKLKANTLIQIWFTFVVFITVAVSLTALLSKIFPGVVIRLDWVALALAVPLTFYKTIKRNLVVHNVTELLVYPGLAAIFVPILRPWSIILLLLIISVYDMWAVWYSKFMVNLAKYQMKNLKMFTGFFVPYLQKKDRTKFEKIKAVKPKSKAMKLMKKKNIQVSLAILGGGDVAFPLIFAGVALRWGAGLIPALLIVAGATLGLLGLFIYSKKGKFYPAMPFITVGCLIGYAVSFLF